jgi:YD repeat-containing protein
MGISGSETKTFAYDSAGDQTQENLKTFAYNQHLRLREVTQDNTPLADYTYDALGRRVKKVSGETTILYLYDQNGFLIEEANLSGTWQIDNVYLNGQPLAKIVNTLGKRKGRSQYLNFTPEFQFED